MLKFAFLRRILRGLGGDGVPADSAVDSLNQEFLVLNAKLAELRDALATLRQAAEKLEEANRRRSDPEEVVLLPVGRFELN